MSLSLAVARRALLLALVALLVAVVALVAAFVADSGSDDAADDVDTADLAEVRTAAAAAQASAEDAAIMSASSAVKADEAAVVAQEAVAMAQQAAAAAEAAAAQAAAAVEALVAAQVAAAAEGDTQPAETSDEATEAETMDATDSDATGPTEEAEEAAEPAAETDAAETDDGDTDAATDPQDADVSETGGDESGEASTDGADGTPDGAPEPAVSLPGEPYEFGPPDGAALAVVGVSHDSVLNVRDVPAGEIVARLDNVMNVGSEPVVYVRRPDSDALIATLDLNRGVIATGSTRKLPTTIWHEIRMADAVGWASSAFLAPLGATSDTTAEIVATLGETPGAPTLVELARIVAGAVASDDPPSRIVVSGAPVIGDLAEITVDVLGLPDDAVSGFRLHILAQQDSESDPFTLKTVESTTICDSYRGVSEEGLCN